MLASNTTTRLARTARTADDEECRLLREAEAGQTLAFERIAWRYDEAILALLLQLTSSEHEAVALCRTTFVSAYENLAHREEPSLYIWLHRLAVMVWLKCSSKEHGHPGLSAQEMLIYTLKTRHRLALRMVAKILDSPEESVARTFCRAIAKLRRAAVR